MGVKMVPSRYNLKAILLQVTHKQIIQQPKYALDNMSAAAEHHLSPTFITTAQVQVMYEDKKKYIIYKWKSLRFLQQYIRQLDEIDLRRMLSFASGSDFSMRHQYYSNLYSYAGPAVP